MVTTLVVISDGVEIWMLEVSFFFSATILTPALALGQPLTKIHDGDIGWADITSALDVADPDGGGQRILGGDGGRKSQQQGWRIWPPTTTHKNDGRFRA